MYIYLYFFRNDTSKAHTPQNAAETAIFWVLCILKMKWRTLQTLCRSRNIIFPQYISWVLISRVYFASVAFSLPTHNSFQIFVVTDVRWKFSQSLSWLRVVQNNVRCNTYTIPQEEKTGAMLPFRALLSKNKKICWPGGVEWPELLHISCFTFSFLFSES